MTNIVKLKETLFSEAEDACDLNRNEKDKECKRAIAISRQILNNIDKEKLIEYIIALRWHILQCKKINKEAKDKIADLTLKYLEIRKRLNKILSKMEGEQNE